MKNRICITLGENVKKISETKRLNSRKVGGKVRYGN